MAEKLIYKKLVSIMKDTKAIGKEQFNQQQKFKFRGIDDIMDSLHSTFADNGVFIVPEVLNFEVNTVPSRSGGSLNFTRATIKFHFVAEDGSEVSTVNVGEAMDSGDKGMNKAMSIALKYALLQMLLIPTKEEKDPDSQSYEMGTVPSQPTHSSELNEALNQLECCNTRKDVQTVWDDWKKRCPDLCVQGNQFYTAVSAKAKALSKSPE